ncbi:metal ABC transporter substrate-binding protein [Desulfobulbus alkaliphilus]|uniref:metal ABC transporter substrate-binding protein n=1 Tax=Desulfobulbus alkaliphilus TaxID=869814 RepID=UPI0019648861|nr:metal ABC transporter substrate-binding protein [Desulfobulbus alkaliphilus]MBM9538073.1 zinc ABC transporter substrate-binding protein [Desulfobulbus alkaliphilus]
MKQSFCRLLTALITCCALLLGYQSPSQADAGTLNILATTFPIYQITRNITNGVDGVQVDLMIPASMGCPHDYALTPADMRKLAAADVLVINGLGLEEFMGAPVQKANPNLRLIDSSQGIDQILAYSEQHDSTSHTDHHHDHHHSHSHDHSHGHDHDHHHVHVHEGPNPHLFASPRMAALLADNIARQLAEIHPEARDQYTAAAETYIKQMQELDEAFSALGQRLRNNRIVTQHGVFDYLARDMGLEIVAVVQAHAGQNPSASEMLAIINTVEEKKAGAIFTEPQYPEAVGKMIAREAGIATATLDPAATGPEQAPLDYYQQVMRNNMVILEQTLGTD